MLRALVIGDSLSGGYYASESRKRWRIVAVSKLSESLGEIEVAGGAKAGGTTKIVSVMELPEGSDFTVIELGTNDSLKTTPWAFRQQYRSLLTRVRAASPDTILVCVGLWRPRWRAWPYDRVIMQEAERAGGGYVSLSNAYADPATRGPAGASTWLGEADNFHPNDVGHERIANRVVTVLRELGVDRLRQAQ